MVAINAFEVVNIIGESKELLLVGTKKPPEGILSMYISTSFCFCRSVSACMFPWITFS